MENEKIVPDCLFEVSWEVCNKIGGIHTVITSKLPLAQSKYSNYILVGPSFHVDGANANNEFEEDTQLLKEFREKAAETDGLILRVGRWKTHGKPIVILVDHTTFVAQKDKIFARFWERFFLDSLSGDWDYIEPMLFGYAAGTVIHSYCKHVLKEEQNVVAHFHEWMSGAGVLYLREHAPEVATVFTTHSTVTGRSLAYNGQPLYKDMSSFIGEPEAKRLGVMAKHSLEKSAAFNADCFTTVSNVTAKECAFILRKAPDCVTPNGFSSIPLVDPAKYAAAKKGTKKLILDVTQRLLGYELEPNPLFVGIGGRLEYKNKGIDAFIDALVELEKNSDLNRQVVAVILIPYAIYGHRKDILGEGDRKTGGQFRYVTHEIHDAEHNQIVKRLEEVGLLNEKANKVKVLYVPSYLNGNDCIFDCSYYTLLQAMDVTAFPSYYEPWGYTPLESLAYGVPTLTTSLSGFGQWVETLDVDKQAIRVLKRDENNYSEIVKEIVKEFLRINKLTDSEYTALVKSAHALAEHTLWDSLFCNYEEAYNFAQNKAKLKIKKIIRTLNQNEMAVNLNRNRYNKPQWKGMIVQSNFPDSLNQLDSIARNLWWSWNYEARELFEELDPQLWEKTRNPISVLKGISADRLAELEKKQEFMFKYDWVVKKFQKYISEKPVPGPRIAYFSMEYGLDDCLKIFSGGLGILAGDYLKEASDTNTNLVAVGFLYKFGYFKQKLSLDGDQLAIYNAQNLSELSISVVKDAEGNHLTIQVGLPGRIVHARVWLVNVGRIKLYLLDTDTNPNSEEDRHISSALYGGDNENRLKQEMLLGIGGVRALEAVGEVPNVYHCNEGHAAFINIERLRKLIKHNGLSFQEALEVVRASTLYTTHTPVPAGHDSFPEYLMMTYMGQFPERLQLSWNEFMNLGRMYADNQGENFSMSNLACNTCHEVNGVSKLHGEVSKDMFTNLWQGYYPEESHVGYVTNGVHYGTWTAKVWRELYESTFGGEDFMKNQSDPKLWEKIHDIKDEEIWGIRQHQRETLINYVKEKLHDSWIQRYEDPKKLLGIFKAINKDALTIGFARRFATYKRAYLLFSNLEKLSKIVNNPERPVQFVFAGKAHPNDRPGQDIIKEIVRISKLPEFAGKIIFLEDYDITLAKRLVQGVDIWLNTPTRPLEASGTSGMKAIMNGVLNFSVLDGWWCEGYKEKAGWALTEKATYEDGEFQNKLDAETIYSILEYEIVPLFYNRDMNGLPRDWVKFIKKSIAQIAPEFTTKRMIDDYKDRFYTKLGERSVAVHSQDFKKAKDIAAWKKKLSTAWDEIQVVSMNVPDNQNQLLLGKNYIGDVTLDLKTLKPEEIGLELVITAPQENGAISIIEKHELKAGKAQGSVVAYSIDIKPSKAGIFNYGIRMYPKNSELPHRQDFCYVRWL